MGDRNSPVTIAIDQGTSSTKALAIDDSGTVIARETVPVGQAHPRPGWVEQDAEEILSSALVAIRRVTQRASRPILTVGVASQRESAIAWDRATGRPLGPMLGWQDRRTAHEARRLIDRGHGDRVRFISGLPIDPMFSALKFAWLLDQIDSDRSESRSGRIALGTVDSFLLFHLTGEHRIEAGNASRTQLLDLETCDWDDGLLDLFRVPPEGLPTVVPSDRPALVDNPALPAKTTIDAVLGDSHAALFGHGVRGPGAVKVTYGTGSSVMGLLAPGAKQNQGLARTVAWHRSGSPAVAFEGNVLATGATLVWLARLFATSPSDLIDEGLRAADSGGVTLVPAFAGLAAPWWRDDAVASLTGFTLGTDRSEIARAAVESIALQVDDVITAAGGPIDELLLDGGPSANDGLVQLQADVSRRRVRRSATPELSAWGAASMAAASVGVPLRQPNEGDSFQPIADHQSMAALRAQWSAAVQRTFHHGRSADRMTETTPSRSENEGVRQ